MFFKFLKYFFWGLLGFFIQTHYPDTHVDFFVLTLAFAFPVLGLGPTTILALALSILYGAHSLSPWAAWCLPASMILLLLRLWKSYLIWPRWMQRAIGMTLLIAGQWSWGWATGIHGTFWRFAQTWVLSLAFGILVVPFFHWVWEFIMQRLPRPRRPMGELPLYLRKTKQARSSGDSRRPFGLERV
jgi:hypothetical protein